MKASLPMIKMMASGRKAPFNLCSSMTLTAVLWCCRRVSIAAVLVLEVALCDPSVAQPAEDQNSPEGRNSGQRPEDDPLVRVMRERRQAQFEAKRAWCDDEATKLQIAKNARPVFLKDCMRQSRSLDP